MIIKHPLYEKQVLFGGVTVNGDKIYYEELTVELPAYDEADNLNVRAPWFVGGSGIQGSNGNANTVLINEKDIPIRAELDGKELIGGLMDTADWNFGMSGESVTIAGRGTIGRMVDRKESRNIKNRTASSVAREIFDYHGVQAQIVDTNRLIGSYSEDNQTSNTDQDDWELLNWLAEWEGFVVRARGKTGFFGPADQLPGLMLDPLPLTYGSNCEVESLSRQQAGAREIIVEVRSYYGGRTIVEYYPRAPAVKKKKKDEEWKFSDETDSESDDDKQETAVIHRFALTGLSQDQLRRRVRSIYDEMTKYDIVGVLMVPKFMEVALDQRISLYGVGLGLSQDYYCTKVSYTESLEGITTKIHISNKLKGVNG